MDDIHKLVYDSSMLFLSIRKSRISFAKEKFVWKSLFLIFVTNFKIIDLSAMKVRLLCLCIFFTLSKNTGIAARLDSLLIVLDNVLESSKTFSGEREMRINTLKGKIASSSVSDEVRYQINESLYMEYKSYICDSAIFYLNKNIDLGIKMKDERRVANSRIMLSHLLSSSGMYMEAIDVLKFVNRQSLKGEDLVNYYVAYDHVYGELGFYTQDKRVGKLYTKKSRAYKDSIYSIAIPDSELYLTMKETEFRDKGKLDQAMSINDQRLAKVKVDSHEYAVVMYYRALIFREKKDHAGYMTCLTLSAMADIRSAIKDHTSLWMLARAIFDSGDVERAYTYMDFSWSETKFYNARLRAWQSVDSLSLIDDTYQTMLRERNKELKFYIFAALCLSCLLLIAIVYIYRQMKKLRIARKGLLDANGKLAHLNEELRNINLSLQTANIELAESNEIKEEYIARFIKLCSTYVDRLDAYRRMVNKKLIANQIQELLKLTRTDTVLEEALDELYANFDSAFLHLFPHFVDRFNELLQENERIVLRKNERLNTELRIFALIRLGITDSSQIAEFLHYSVNTIYNYRSKVKNKACVSREDFESLVASIR